MCLTPLDVAIGRDSRFHRDVVVIFRFSVMAHSPALSDVFASDAVMDEHEQAERGARSAVEAAEDKVHEVLLGYCDGGTRPHGDEVEHDEDNTSELVLEAVLHVDVRRGEVRGCRSRRRLCLRDALRGAGSLAQLLLGEGLHHGLQFIQGGRGLDGTGRSDEQEAVDQAEQGGRTEEGQQAGIPLHPTAGKAVEHFNSVTWCQHYSLPSMHIYSLHIHYTGK